MVHISLIQIFHGLSLIYTYCLELINLSLIAIRFIVVNCSFDFEIMALTIPQIQITYHQLIILFSIVKAIIIN